MERFLETTERYLWGWPLLLLLMSTGLLLLIRLRAYPILALPRAIGLVFRRRKTADVRVSPFGALCTALSAAVGTGNIVGVASALSLGGAGALFWMEISAILGLSLRYAEGWLSIRYRARRADGSHWGGPFLYVQQGLGERWKPLAVLFAFLGAAAGLCGAGTFVQIGSVTACLRELLNQIDANELLGGVLRYGVVEALIAGFSLLTALLAGLILFQGMRRVSRVSSVLVPLMGGLYAFCCLWILIRRREALPEAIRSIFQTAFRPRAVGGGLLGTVMAGVSRGLFSNEAGIGTAPIASAAADGVSPEEQGLISMTAIVFDTFILCTLTGLVLLVTGTQSCGIGAAMNAFAVGLPVSPLAAKTLVFLILTLFAFTTVVGWSCIGTGCLDYLSDGNRGLRRAYLIVYLAEVLIAPWCSARALWTAANIWNGLMAIPNLTALCFLSGKIGRNTKLQDRKKNDRSLIFCPESVIIVKKRKERKLCCRTYAGSRSRPAGSSAPPETRTAPSVKKRAREIS